MYSPQFGNMDKSIVTLLLALLVLSTQSQPLYGKTLSATIEHKKVLPSVPEELRAGATFDDSYLQAMSSSKWFKIPDWLAGTWQRKRIKKRVMGMAVVSVADHRIRHFGHQVDARKEIWHWVKVPRRIITERPNLLSYFFASDESCEEIDKNTVKVRTIWTAWSVNKSNNQIVKVQQGDQIDIFKLKASGKLKADSYTQYYNQSGIKIASQRAYWEESKIEEFNQIDFQDNQNLRVLFEEFLKQNGLTDLL